MVSPAGLAVPGLLTLLGLTNLFGEESKSRKTTLCSLLWAPRVAVYLAGGQPFHMDFRSGVAL